MKCQLKTVYENRKLNGTVLLALKYFICNLNANMENLAAFDDAAAIHAYTNQVLQFRAIALK